MQDGIYFGLPDDEYHALQRLSASAIQRLRVSPATWWADSWLNPNPKVLTPDQEQRQEMVRILGRAYHCARLEPDHFHERFVRALDQADWAGVDGFVSNGTQIGEALAELGQSKKKAGETVLEQAHRLRAAGYEGPIWHLELEAWEARRGERTAVPATSWDEIMVDMERITKVPAVHALLSGGAAEVSILWTCPDTGLPMKARVDYLRADLWVDFKTFTNVQGKNLNRAIVDAFKYGRYYLQAAVYRDAVEAVRSGELDVIGKATPDQLAIIDAIRARPQELACHYVFQEKGGVPNLLERRVRFWEIPLNTQIHHAGATEEQQERMNVATRKHSALLTKALWEIKAAKRDFMSYSEIYPAGHEWLPFNPSGEFTDEDFSNYWLDEDI